jgi:hypothetical protein
MQPVLEGKGEHVYFASDTRMLLRALTARLGLSKSAVIREALKTLAKAVSVEVTHE